MANILKKIFGKKEPKGYLEADTLPLDLINEQENGGIEPPEKSSDLITEPVILEAQEKRSITPPQIIAGCAQSAGIQRKHNEDALFCLTTLISGDGIATPFGIYIVADGMGGHKNGEIASEIAVRTMATHIIEEIFLHHISPTAQAPSVSIQEIMREGMNKAHESVKGEAIGGGTTLTALTIFGKQMTIAHAGDSRIYQIDSNAAMEPLTRDHSLVKRLEELGQLTPEEAAVDPRRNVLYHALGQGTPLEPEILSMPCPHSGYLLICSDGLWGVISENTISAIIQKNHALSDACQEMVEAANMAGGPDNITVILIKLPER